VLRHGGHEEAEMRGTRDVFRALVRANPGRDVTEDQIRWALRRGLIQDPERIAGRLVWSDADVVALASVLGVAVPETDSIAHRVGVV